MRIKIIIDEKTKSLLIIGLGNATILPSEKGFYAFAFLLAIFGAIAVQKNTRDNMIQD